MLHAIDRVGLIEAATCMRASMELARMGAGILGMFPGRCAERAQKMYHEAEELGERAREMEARALVLDDCEVK